MMVQQVATEIMKEEPREVYAHCSLLYMVHSINLACSDILKSAMKCDTPPPGAQHALCVLLQDYILRPNH